MIKQKIQLVLVKVMVFALSGCYTWKDERYFRNACQVKGGTPEFARTSWEITLACNADMIELKKYKHVHQTLWSELEQAATDREHGWRTPVLATVDANGLPDARTVVLREVDHTTQTLKVFTDQRSPKVAQLQATPLVQLVFWCPNRQWQLRVRASVTIDTSSEQVTVTWKHIRETAAASDYLTAGAPGSVLTDLAPLAADQHALCLLVFKVESLDWLMLSPQKHRRARLEHDTLIWIMP